MPALPPPPPNYAYSLRTTTVNDPYVDLNYFSFILYKFDGNGSHGNQLNHSCVIKRDSLKERHFPAVWGQEFSFKNICRVEGGQKLRITLQFMYVSHSITPFSFWYKYVVLMYLSYHEKYLLILQVKSHLHRPFLHTCNQKKKIIRHHLNKFLLRRNARLYLHLWNVFNYG